MAKLIHAQTNFTAGEISPRMKGRGDVARYQNGAERIENAIVVVHGGAMRRAGFRYLAATKHANRRCRLIRYVFSTEVAYVLEFGHQYVRVFDGATGAVIVDDALDPIEIASPYTEAQLFDVTVKQSADAMFLFHPDVPTQQLQRLSGNLWVMRPIQWVTEPFAEIGHTPNARLTIDNPAVGAGRSFTTEDVAPPDAPTAVVATPFNGAAAVNFTPPADTGGAPITGYTVTVSPGGAEVFSPVRPVGVPGLTNGQAYTFTVKAHNKAGASDASAASAPVTPLASLPGGSITATATPAIYNAQVFNGTFEISQGPTASGTGGVAPYTAIWSKQSGDPAITVVGSNGNRVIFRSHGINTVRYATLRATVTDAIGSVGTVDVPISVAHSGQWGGGGGDGEIVP